MSFLQLPWVGLNSITYRVRFELPLYGAFQESLTVLALLSRTFNPLGASGFSWMMRLMEVSSDPNAFVATQVNRAESDRCVRLILIVDKTPPSLCSSLIVYLLKSNYHNCSMFVGFIFFLKDGNMLKDLN